MKVLLRRNISKVGQIGDVVDVKPGYARNYLVPQGLAVQPTPGNLKAVEAEKEEYLAKVAAERQALQARADAIDGKEITLSARANEEGHLYGSVGPAQICEALAVEGVFVEPQQVALHEPIRQLDKYDLPLEFAEDIRATIHVWVLRHHEPGEEPIEGEAAEPAESETAEPEEPVETSEPTE